MLAFWVTLVVQGCTLFGILWINYKYSENSKEKMKYLSHLTIFSMVLIMILFETEPFGLKRTLSTISGGHGGDWLQFWGTYLGIIFSVVLTLYVTNKQGEIDRENARTIHSIEIYIDNLMSALNTLNELSEFVSRCKQVASTNRPYQVDKENFSYDVVMILLLKRFESDDISKKVNRLINIIEKMPLKTKENINNDLNILADSAKVFEFNDYLALEEDGATLTETAINHLIKEYNHNKLNFNLFFESACEIENFVVKELNFYNRID